MLCEFTAIYEPEKDGWIRAYVLEVPGCSAHGRTLEEARHNLAEMLRVTLNSYRVNLLNRAVKQATVELLQVELPSLCGEVDRALATVSGLKTRTFTQDHVKQALLENGVITEPGSSANPADWDDDFEPVPIEGKPISEEIIEARR